MWYLADARKAHVTLCVDVDGDKSLLMVLMLLPSSDSVLLCGRFRKCSERVQEAPEDSVLPSQEFLLSHLRVHPGS